METFLMYKMLLRYMIILLNSTLSSFLACGHPELAVLDMFCSEIFCHFHGAVRNIYASIVLTLCSCMFLSLIVASCGLDCVLACQGKCPHIMLPSMNRFFNFISRSNQLKKPGKIWILKTHTHTHIHTYRHTEKAKPRLKTAPC